MFLECNAATRVLCGVKISIFVNWRKGESMGSKGNINVNNRIGLNGLKILLKIRREQILLELELLYRLVNNWKNNEYKRIYFFFLFDLRDIYT